MNIVFTQSNTEIDWKLAGRLFVDGNVYIRSANTLHSTLGMPDVRLSGKISFHQHWIDIGFANNQSINQRCLCNV